MRILKLFLLLIVSAVFPFGCGGGGSAPSGTAVQAPSNLTYSNTAPVYSKGTPIPINAPSNTGSCVQKFL